MEQAIADYAVMIQALRQQYKFTKVIAFGGRCALIRFVVVNYCVTVETYDIACFP